MRTQDVKKKKLPDSPGVYFFLGPRKKIVYIGKAASLRDRVRSYFSKDVLLSRGPAIVRMIQEARDVAYEKTDSVLEALILESRLIKKHQPVYNVRDKDNKSFNYVVITDEDFPKVLRMRQREIITGKFSGRSKIKSKSDLGRRPALYGPFPQGGVLKEALVIVRKIFPFRDSTCAPLKGKPCFNRQIGLCPGVCTGEISRREYRKIIRNIKLLFENRKKSLVSKLTKEMKLSAKKHQFEQAAKLRNTIFALKHIQDVSLIKENLKAVNKSIQSIFPKTTSRRELDRYIFRIEAYDVAHMAGDEIVGVMVVVEDGELKKSDYRKFKLKTITTSNDPGALKEILERRLKHGEWALPQLIVVDGGKAQINTASRVLNKISKVGPWTDLSPESGDKSVDKSLKDLALERAEIIVVGVVKDERHRPKKILGNKKIINQHEKEILLANNEAHRFAIFFHRRRLRKRMHNSVK